MLQSGGPFLIRSIRAARFCMPQSWAFGFFPIANNHYSGACGPAPSRLSSPGVCLQWLFFHQFFLLVLPRMIQSRVALLLPRDVRVLLAAFSPGCFAPDVQVCNVGPRSPALPWMGVAALLGCCVLYAPVRGFLPSFTLLCSNSTACVLTSTVEPLPAARPCWLPWHVRCRLLLFVLSRTIQSGAVRLLSPGAAAQWAARLS